MPAIVSFEELFEVKIAQEQYIQALNTLKNNIQAQRQELQEIYTFDVLQGKPYVYVSYNHLNSVQPEALNPYDVSCEYDIWMEMSHRKIWDYLEMISNVNELQANNPMFDSFFGAGKFLILIRTFGEDFNIPSALSNNSGAYIIKVQ